jgi:hypothetical protein
MTKPEPIHPLVLSRLRLLQAEAGLKAEERRRAARGIPSTSNRALGLAREARDYQRVADGYAVLLALAEQKPKEAG